MGGAPYMGPARPIYGPSQGQIWARHIWERTFLRNSILKSFSIVYIIGCCHLDISSKRRAPENDKIWRRLQAEISHLRLIQGQKLKLFEV